MITYCIVTAFLNVLGGVVLGISVLLKAPRSRTNHLFAWFAASAAIWSCFYLLWQLAQSEEEALYFARALTGAAILIPISYFHFASRLTGRSDAIEIRVGYVTALILASFTFSPYLVAAVAPAMMFPYWPQPGPVFWPYIFIFLYFTVRSWMVLFVALRQASHWRKRQLAYVCFGTAIGWVGGLSNFLLWFDIPVPPVGNGLALVYILSVGYAMMRFRLVDINVFVVKGVAYLLVIAFFSLTFLVFSATFVRHVPAGMNNLVKIADYLAAFLTTLALFAFAPGFTRRVNEFLEEKAFRAYGSNRHRLREYIGEISTFSDLNEIFRETAAMISESLKVPQVEVYYRLDYEVDCGFQAGSLEGISFFKGERLPHNGWLVQKTRSSGKALVIYEQERSGDDAAIIAEYERLGLELAIPIHADRVFYGLVLCGTREGRRLYSDLDISLLQAVCIQIGLTIRAREIERRSNRTEKLISLGTLAAGLAHELRNPLVSITTFTGLIAEQGADPEFRRQFQSVVDRDVKRIGAIIDQVGAFANNGEASFSWVNLSQVLRDVGEIAQPELEQIAATFSLEDQEGLPAVYGNYSQLIQAFLNLVQNAIQALAKSASPSIRISFKAKRYRDGTPWVMVAVTDNGPGIPVWIRSRIFDPFVTTKNTGPRERDRGMGLGLGIVKGIIEAHGGSIDISSTTGTGTTFYVELPCDEERKISGSSPGNMRKSSNGGGHPVTHHHQP